MTSRSWISMGAAIVLALILGVTLLRRSPENPREKPAPRREPPATTGAPTPASVTPPNASPTPPPVPEDAATRKKRFDDMHAKAPPPPPLEPERIRWLGPISVFVRILSPRDTGAGRPVVFLSRLPIPVEISLARIPDKTLRPVPLDAASWKAALVAKLAKDGDPAGPLACALDIEGVYRGGGAERLDVGPAKAADFPDAGLTLRGSVHPLQTQRSPGAYSLTLELDAAKLFSGVPPGEPQISPKAPVELREEATPDDQVAARMAELAAFLEKGRNEEALRAARELLKLRPKSVGAHYYGALALWKTAGSADEAIVLMEAAMKNLESDADPDPAYRDLEERTRRQMLSTMRNWIEERRREKE